MHISYFSKFLKEVIKMQPSESPYKMILSDQINAQQEKLKQNNKKLVKLSKDKLLVNAEIQIKNQTLTKKIMDFEDLLQFQDKIIEQAKNIKQQIKQVR